MRMSCSYDPLCKDEVDEEEDKDASTGKDLSSQCHPNIRPSCCPDDTHHHCYDASHAKTKHQGRHDELVALLLVQLEDCHVADCGTDKEEKEDCRYGNIYIHRGDAARQGDLWCVWWSLWRSILLSVSFLSGTSEREIEY